MKKPTIKDVNQNIKEFLDKKKLSPEEAVRSLLSRKQPDVTEIEISLFQACNLRCAMCWQDQDDETGLDTIVEKADIVIDYLHNWEHKKPEVQVTITGGELFQNGLDKYDDYFNMIKKINDNVDDDITFCFITNLSFNQETSTKVKNFLNRCKDEKIKVALATSWDTTGRPLKNTIDSDFYKNLVTYKDDILGITLVLTKPTINVLLRKGDEFLDFLYNDGYNVQFDYYVPTESAAALMPTDRDLLNVFRMFSIKYPKLGLMEAWKNGEINIMSCGSLNKITILPDGSISTCRQLDYEQDEFETKINNTTNTNMMLSFMERQGCLTCPYFDRCTLSCFVMNDHKSYLSKKELDRCLYQILFEELDNEK